MRGQLEICLLTRRGHYRSGNMLNSHGANVYTQISGKEGSRKKFYVGD